MPSAYVQVGVAMIFGFFMLWDLPTISAGVSSLAKSRLAPLYAELSPVLGVFGKLFGRALEAQARIALVNTALTAVGMWLLAIPGIGLLSMFVFICSFIPIAGVIISTTPIGFVALTEYGFMKLALVIIMVTAVHFVEVGGCSSHEIDSDQHLLLKLQHSVQGLHSGKACPAGRMLRGHGCWWTASCGTEEMGRQSGINTVRSYCACMQASPQYLLVRHICCALSADTGCFPCMQGQCVLTASCWCAC